MTKFLIIGIIKEETEEDKFMNYNLEICIANIDDNIQNPSTEQVRNAIISLSEKGEFNDFIILATEQPVNNIEFIQCTPSGDSLYLVEAKVGSEQHQAFLYQKTVDKSYFKNFMLLHDVQQRRNRYNKRKI